MNNRIAWSLLLPGFVIGSFALGHAQGVPTMTTPPPLPTHGPGVAVVQESGVEIGFQFVSEEPPVSMPVTPLVKGSPYSLDATIESTQTLSDGNRIFSRQTAHLYRDSKGRTRREKTSAAIGPWAASGIPSTMITIQDPVSGASYLLDPQRKIATKLPPTPTGNGVMVTGGMVNGDARPGPVTASMDSGAVSGGFVSAGDANVSVLEFNGGPGDGKILQPAEKSDSLGKKLLFDCRQMAHV